MMTIANQIGANSSPTVHFGHVHKVSLETVSHQHPTSDSVTLHSHSHDHHDHSNCGHDHAPKPMQSSEKVQKGSSNFVSSFFKNLYQSAFKKSNEPKSPGLGFLKATKLWFQDYVNIIVEDAKRLWAYLSGSKQSLATHQHDHDHSNCGHDHH